MTAAADVQLHKNVSRLLEEVGGLRGTLETFIENQNTRTSGLEERQRTVEHKVHWWSGVGSVVGTIFGAVLTFGATHLRG